MSRTKKTIVEQLFEGLTKFVSKVMLISILAVFVFNCNVSITRKPNTMLTTIGDLGDSVVTSFNLAKKTLGK